MAYPQSTPSRRVFDPAPRPLAGLRLRSAVLFAALLPVVAACLPGQELVRKASANPPATPPLASPHAAAIGAVMPEVADDAAAVRELADLAAIEAGW